MKTLRELLERAAPAGALEAARVLRAWEEVAREAGVFADADYRAGRLTLRARTHVDAQELALRAGDIRQRVNGRLGVELVREVRVGGR